MKKTVSLCLFQDKKKYLDTIHSYMEVHGTVHGTSTVHLPSYVKNHGILSGRDLQFLLRETKVGPFLVCAEAVTPALDFRGI